MVGFGRHFLFELKRRQITDHKGLWVNSFFRQMAYALIGVFAAIFVFSFGRENFLGGGVKNGLLLLLLFLLMVRLVVLVGGIFMAEYVIDRIGYRKTIFLSLVLSSLAFMCLSGVSVTGRWELVLVSGGLFGMVVNTYWVVYYTLLSGGIKKNNVGRSYGVLEAVSKLGQVMAPLLGALLAVKFGFSMLFVSGIGLLLISSIPIWFLPRHLHLDKVSWKEFFEWASEMKFLRLGLAMGGDAVNEVIYADVWSVYVFLMLGSLKSMGVFGSVVLMATVVFTYLVSWVFDKKSRREFQIVGVSGGIMVWISRAFVGGLGQVLLVDTLDKFFYSLSHTFFSGYMLRRSQGKENFSYMVYRELWRSIWLIVVYVFLGIMLFVVDIKMFWLISFGVGALGLILSLLVEDHK